MDVESLGDVSVSSSVERQAMREQLDAVRQTLNALATAAQPNPNGVNAAPAGIEHVLSDIASKLSNIEGLYSCLTSKLEKVDVRVEDSERHIKDLQHLSASAIHETARLVDHYAGARGTPGARTASQAGAGPSSVSAGATQRARHMAASGMPVTPPPASLSPARSTVPALDYVPGHITATVQQHAAQIHKLIAGLDFLEAHIIRQDQVVEGLQKQLLSVARDAAATSAVVESRTSPSELSLRIHDMGELLNKLRAHMYKVEKKTSSNDQALVLLRERIQAVEQLGPSGSRVGEGASEQDAAVGPSLAELVATQEELRSMVQDLCRDVLELRDQMQAQAAAQAPRPPEPVDTGLSAGEGAEMRRQLSYLMSQVPALLMENKELKDFAARATSQIDDLSTAIDQNRREMQQLQQVGASVPSGGSETGSTATDEIVTELRADVASLREQIAAMESRLQSTAMRGDIEALSSPSADTVAQLGSTLTGVQGSLAAVQAEVTAVQERVTALQGSIGGRAEEAAAAKALDAVKDLPEPQSPPPAAEDTVAKVSRIKGGSPEAALLASQVSAAAKADLEEQFGQLRHRIELATAVAEAAEEAARRSAESAAVATSALETISQADTTRAASLQETVLAMVAGVEQEQTALKQQLAELAAQVSNEQGAILSGLQQMQEQVAAAATAATEAAACAQAVQQQQTSGSHQEQQAAEALQAVQAELREQVASVMERLKLRVEEGMQQMDSQLSAVSERLSGAVTTAQLEAALTEGLSGTVTFEQFDAAVEQLRTAAADSAERYELASASLEELRAEMILLTGQQDVVQSRLLGLESILGVDTRSSPLGLATTSSTLPPTIEENEEEGEEGEQDVQGEVSRELRASVGALSVLATAGSITGARGLLDLVAELQSRVGGLEGALEAAAADMDQLRDLYLNNTEKTQDTIQQATAQLIADLQGLSAAVDECAARTAADILAMEAATAAVQQKVSNQASITSELVARMEEVQLRLESEILVRIKETSGAVSSLSARVARDYVNREQLGAIFQARADMKRAVDELATVFNTGRLLRTASHDEEAAYTAADGSSEPEGHAQRANSGTLSPRLVAALEDLAGKQAELEHQVQLALYRTENAVRQEQLTGVQQAMMTLELQFRRLGTATAHQAQPPALAEAQAASAGAPADVSQALSTELAALRARVEALEAAATMSTTSEPSEPAATGREALPDAATSLLSAPPSVQAVRVSMIPDDPADTSTPIRLRLLVAEQPRYCATDSARPCSAVAGSATEEAREPSLLHNAASPAPKTVSLDAHQGGLSVRAAGLDEEQLQALHRALQDLAQQSQVLQSEVAAEGAERQRLAEALADLQERLDLQVNATASTAAMVATMATDQPQKHVRLQVRVGVPEPEDLAALAATVATLASRVEAAEEALASAFVVRTPRSPTRATAAAAAAAAAATGADSADAQKAADGASHGLIDPGDEEAAAQHETGSSSEEDIRPALGLMVPVMPREVEQQIATLQAEQQKLEAALSALVVRVDGLEAVDALEEVRAAASEAVLDAIPGMVVQRVSVAREEITAMVGRQAEEMLGLASQAARDAAEAVLAVREAAAEAAAARDAVTESLAVQAATTDERHTAMRAAMEVAEAAATEAAAHAAAAREAAVEAAAAREGILEAQAAAQAAAEEAEKAADAAAATASAREAALDVAMSVAREVAEEAARETATREVPVSQDDELVGSVAQLVTEVKGIRGAVGSLTERMNDVDTLRDQLEALAAQVRDSMSSSSAAPCTSDVEPAAGTASASAQGPPSTPNAAAAAVASIFTPAATALVIPPAHTPRPGAAAAGAVSPSPGGTRTVTTPQAPATGSQQAAFLARLVAVVKRQSSRLHAQYSDAEETGVALSQVDHTLEEAEARLADVRDANSTAFAETLVTVLEQVAALRYIGSQTHPAVQQMVLEHENRLDKISEELKALGGGSPTRAGARPAAGTPETSAPYTALAEDVGAMSRQVARMEAELTRVAGQQAALDRAVKDVLTAVGSVRMGSAAGSSIADPTESRRATSHENFMGEEAPAPVGETLLDAEPTGAAAGEDAAAEAVAVLEAAGLAAQVRLLEDTLAAQLDGLRQELMAEIRTRAGSGGGAASVTAATAAAELSALEKTVSQQHSALTAVRNRVLAVQEYVDSTQGMIKDMHVALGTLHRRVDGLEAQLGPGAHSTRVSGSGAAPGADASNIRELQSDLSKFERRLLTVESGTLDAAHALADLKGLAPRVSETEARLLDACSKLAVALGGSASSTAPVIPAVPPNNSLPALSTAVRLLERRLGGRLEAACGALDTLASALSAAGRIQAESTANPFKAISAAVNNPVMVAMEKKLETVRAEILAAATSLSEDMRRDLQQQQLESRLAASADVSVSGGSVYGGAGGSRI